MDRYLLDTNALSSLVHRPSGVIGRRILNLPKGALVTSPIVLCEVRFGLEKRNSATLNERVHGMLTTVEVLPFSPGFPEPNDPAIWVETAGTNNLQVRVTRAGLEFATKEVERNRAGHRPTLDAFATYTDSGSGVGTVGVAGTDTKAGVVGLQLAIPIYQGGLISSRVREALANEEKPGRTWRTRAAPPS